MAIPRIPSINESEDTFLLKYCNRKPPSPLIRITVACVTIPWCGTGYQISQHECDMFKPPPRQLAATDAAWSPIRQLAAVVMFGFTSTAQTTGRGDPTSLRLEAIAITVGWRPSLLI